MQPEMHIKWRYMINTNLKINFIITLRKVYDLGPFSVDYDYDYNEMNSFDCDSDNDQVTKILITDMITIRN